MWITTADAAQRSTSMSDASIDIIVEPRESDAKHLAVINITVPPGALLPPHNHGESDAVLIALAGQLLLFGADEKPHLLEPGKLAVVAANERVSAENKGDDVARILVCFAPPTFVEALGGRS